MKKKYGFGILLLVLNGLLTIGIVTLFRGCGVHEDGGYSTCHWAERAVLVLGLVLMIQSLLVLLLPGRMVAGVMFAMIPVALAAAFLPGRAIELCMMETMRCHTIMKPAALVLGCGIALVAAVGGVFLAREKR